MKTTKTRENGYLVTHYQEDGNGPINVTITPGSSYSLKDFRLHLDVAGGTSENLTIDISDPNSNKHNLNIVTKDMLLVKDYIFTPDSICLSIVPDNSIVIQYTNTNRRIWGLDLVISQE